MQFNFGNACLTTTTQLPFMSSFLAVLLMEVWSSSMFKFVVFVPMPEHVKMKLQRFSGDQKNTCLKNFVFSCLFLLCYCWECYESTCDIVGRSFGSYNSIHVIKSCKSMSQVEICGVAFSKLLKISPASSPYGCLPPVNIKCNSIPDTWISDGFVHSIVAIFLKLSYVSRANQIVEEAGASFNWNNAWNTVNLLGFWCVSHAYSVYSKFGDSYDAVEVHEYIGGF